MSSLAYVNLPPLLGILNFNSGAAAVVPVTVGAIANVPIVWDAGGQPIFPSVGNWSIDIDLNLSLPATLAAGYLTIVLYQVINGGDSFIIREPLAIGIAVGATAVTPALRFTRVTPISNLSPVFARIEGVTVTNFPFTITSVLVTLFPIN